jgi:CBS domain-containing protein
MKITEVCQRDVVVATREASLAHAAKLMRERHVGSVVIVDAIPAGKPVGILTDRDIVVEVIAAGLDPRAMTVGEIMSAPPLTVRDDDDALTALKAMRLRGVRRVPVVDAAGLLVGIASLDDLLENTGDALNDIVLAMRSERSLESWRRR